MEQNKGENKERRDCRGTLQRALNYKAHFIILTCIITLVLIATLGVVNLIENSERIRGINSGGPKAEAEKISEEKVYSIFMVLNELSTRNDVKLGGNKINVNTNSEDLTISYFNAISGTPIEKNEEETIEVPEEGIKLKIDGIKEGQSYDIEVENAQTIEDYEETFKKATITVDASAEGELEAYVKEITKEDDVGASSARPGSEEKVAIFAYEEEDTGRIKIKGNKDVEIYYVIEYNSSSAEEMDENNVGALGEDDVEELGDDDDVGAHSNVPLGASIARTIEEIDESEWQLYNPEEGVQLEKNGVIYSKSKYKDGTYSEINTLHINNIDKLAPEIEVTDQEANEENSEVTVTISMQDKEATDEYGKSGIYGYAITSTQEEPEEFMPCEADEVSIDGVGAHSNVPVGEISTSPEEPITVEVGGITKNGTYYAWTQDKAGNTSHKEITVSEIEDEEEHIVAIILDTPKEAEDLEGKEYYSLAELMQELDEKSITAESGQVVIQIVSDIKNASTKIADKNLVIDLNGYTIASKLQEPTLKVISGNVAIVDNKYDIADYISETKKLSETPTVGASSARPEDEEKSLLQYLQEEYQSKKQKGEGDVLEECDGKVYNEKFIAVQIEEGATVTLGENEATAAVPNIKAPQVRGGLKGVQNRGGTFNFYDGEIIGKVPVEGEIADTPSIYNSTLTEAENEEGVYKDILQKVAGIEALIGTTRYTQLEEAINTATNEEEQTQIDIVADITKNKSIIVDENKNVLLNLNGYTVTNTSADYVIQNSGKLEIIDTTITEKDEEETIKGKIISNTYNTILNKEGGSFKLTSGTITNPSKTIIQNEGTFELNGGYITTTSTSSSVYGIENLNNGEIITKAGIIKTYYYSIYNQNTATVTIQGGEVISTRYYPLFNNGTGKITVKEGKVTGYERVIQNQGNGEVIVEGGEVTATYTGSSYVIYNNNAGKITVTGGTITGNRALYGIYNYSTGEIIIKGGEIIATSTSSSDVTYGISNIGAGNIIIEGGTINSTKGTAIYNNSTGTITIGKEDGTVENEKINIKGKNYGVYNDDGTLNYYDGTITGGKNAIRSVINDIEENHDVALENIEDGEQAKIVKQSQIAYIGNEQDTLYDNLQSAIDECANEEKTITLVKDITVVVAKTIQENQNITLNLNGHKIVSYSYDSALINNGNLTITDELEGQISAYGTAIKNKGELIVSGGTISSDGEGTSAYSYGIYNEEGGTVKVTAGEINAKITGRGGSNAYSYAYGIYNEGTGTIEISGGTMSSTYVEAGNYCYASSYTVYNAGEGTVTIKDGANITGTAYGIYNNGAGEIDIEGGKITTTSTRQPVFNAGEGTIIVRDGTITGDYYAIRNESSGMIEIKGGNISSKNYQAIVNVGAGKIKITGGTITAPARSNYSVIENSSTGTIEIEGGEITAEGVNDSIIAVRNSGRGKITIRGGTISATQIISSYSTYSTYGIYNSSTGEIEITGGTITAKATTTYYTGTVNTYGIYNYSTGTITIGENEGQVKQETPTITATATENYTGTQQFSGTLNSYGLYNASGTVNFYDGTITGGTNAISGAVTNMPYGYQVKYEDSMKKATLELKADFEGAIKVESTYYEKISTAVNIISNMEGKTGVIHVCKDLINIDDIITIPAETNITLALEGHRIEFSGVETAITNNGNLTIIDFEDKSQSNSDTLSLLKNENKTVIQNNGTLVIGQEENGNPKSPRIEGQTAISGTDAELKSGELVGQHPSSIMAYSTSVMSLTNEEGQLVLSLKPETDYNSKEWTKENVKIDIQADIIPTLNLYSAMTRPPLSYTKTATIEPGIAHQTLETIETVGASIARPEGLELTETEVTAGDTITYTIQVHNEGEIEAKEVIVQDTVPMGTKLVQAENEGKEQDGEITWTIPTIEAGQTAEVSFIVEVEYAKEEYTIENTATVDGEETNTTQNQYKKPIAQLTSSLEKTTEQTVIPSKQENVCYEIKFNANVNDFVGKTKVTIVDTLPYPIDKNSSTLLDGDYDEYNHTITWEIEESNINTFEQGEQKTVTITKEISLKYDYTSLTDVNEPIRNEVESTIELLEEDEESDEGYIIVKTDDQSSQVESTMEIPAEVIVHHYIYDDEAELEEDKYTEEELIADERKEGIVGREYETSKSSEVPKNYVCINDEPEKHSGIYKEEPIEVKYYYRLLTPTIEKSVTKEVTSEKNKEGEVVLTKEDGEVSYKITYNTTITNYIGKATIKIVDQLPAKINKDKSELAGGVYSEDNRTITWTKEVEIDTFEDGKYKEKIVKEIKLVYIDQDVTQNLVNAVKGETITYYPEGYPNKDDNQEFAKEEIEDNISIKQDYRANFKVVKVWDDDEDSRGNRPQSVKITITVDQVGKSTTQILNEDNNWTYEETNLPKYNELTGEKITYTITESETNEGELQYYKQPVITITEKQNEEATNYTYTVTNSYKLKEADFNIEMSKVGPSEITNKNDKVAYTINFNAEIPDYIGKAKVTLVDTLPFAINKANSKLDDGDYDEETNTITWVEELDIDTEELGTSYKIDITKQIELAYIGIDLTQESIVNEVKGTVILEGTDEIDIEATTSNTDINVQGKVIVRYVDKNTGKDIVGASSARPDGTYTYEITGKVGSTYNAEVKTFDNYDYIDEGKATGTIKEGKEEIILYYTKAKLKVLVKYQDKEGNSISEDVLIEGYIGDIYKTEQKEIENYRFVEVKGKTEGVMTEREIIITYIYEKIEIGEVTVKYVDIDTDEEIIGSSNARPEGETYGYTITGYVGDEYETEEKEIPYYVLVKSTDNTEGTLTDTEITVIYYYRKKVFNFSMEKTISKITLNGEELRVKDNKLVKVELKPSQIENSELILSYNIKVTNEGELAGKVKALEKIPKGFEIVTKEDWIEREDGNLETEVELDVEESKDLTVMLRWTNSENNLGPMKNTVELIESNNIANYEDTYEENDTSEATILISIKTGWKVSTMIIVTMLSSMVITGYLILVIIRNFGKGPNIKNIKFLNR